MPENDSTRRINTLERHREEDRQQMQEIGGDIAELVAAVRESNVYYKESYKRIEKGEKHRADQDKAISSLSDTILKNQPAVDSVNRIKVGLMGVAFTVMAGLLTNWFIATKDPIVGEYEYRALIEELKELRAHKLDDH
ncbi:TMhelix containing protein [Vibrio phage 1.257.O._10N.286.46.A4]|nr:TMhelix containing protein [Vibrio phage 1.257.O._10N.286.46.A4]